MRRPARCPPFPERADAMLVDLRPHARLRGEDPGRPHDLGHPGARGARRGRRGPGPGPGGLRLGAVQAELPRRGRRAADPLVRRDGCGPDPDADQRARRRPRGGRRPAAQRRGRAQGADRGPARGGPRSARAPRGLGAGQQELHLGLQRALLVAPAPLGGGHRPGLRASAARWGERRAQPRRCPGADRRALRCLGRARGLRRVARPALRRRARRRQRQPGEGLPRRVPQPATGPTDAATTGACTT